LKSDKKQGFKMAVAGLNMTPYLTGYPFQGNYQTAEKVHQPSEKMIDDRKFVIV
jgi:hypothetical protein